MIKADEALKISISTHMEILERKIKEAAEKSLRQLSLKGLKGCVRLSPEEKRILQDNGFKITTGHSGKGGEFDVINW